MIPASIKQALDDIGVAPSFAQVMNRVFRCTEIAETEAAAMGFDPATMPSDQYMALRVPPQFEHVAVEWVYRAHVRELLARLADENVLRAQPRVDLLVPGTEAEVLVGLIHACGLAPLVPSAQDLAEYLWRRLAPPELAKKALGELPSRREKWDGHREDTLREARRSCRAEWRKLTKKGT
jgi:hypothetical protein